ncbi:putative B-cell receptor-associated protein [Helianthus debilis subsp. tardiflorus]
MATSSSPPPIYGFAVNSQSTTMIYLFFGVLFIEMVTILLLLFKTPLRKLLIIGLDSAKRGRAPLVLPCLSS